MNWTRDDNLPNPLQKLGMGLGFFRRYADSFWKATGMELDLVYTNGEPWDSIAQRIKGDFCRTNALNPSNVEACQECFISASRIPKNKNSFHTVCCHAGQNFSIRSLGKMDGIGVNLLIGRVMTVDPENQLQNNPNPEAPAPKVKSPESYKAALDLIEFSLPYLRVRLATELLLAAREFSPLVRKACHYVDQNFRENITVAGIAEACGASVDYLSRCFSEQTGNLLSHYIAAIRTGHAMYLLREEKLGIAEIAYESGFQSLSQFNRTFRSLQGMTPSQFRRKELSG